MKLPLKMVSNRHILKTRPPKDKLLHRFVSLKTESCRSFKLRPYLKSYVPKFEKKPYNLKGI